MRLKFDDFYDRSLDAVLWVYAAATMLSPLALAWFCILGPVCDTPKFAPRRPVTPSEGKTIPGDPEAPLQTPCKTQIDPKN